MAQGAMPRRASTCANHGAMSASLWPLTAWCAAQCASVCGGVRKLDDQFTVVLPPTARPCRMAMAPSAVVRAAASWYSSR
ncbi:hypothetical protein D3C81_1374640 [compost metagenome]